MYHRFGSTFLFWLFSLANPRIKVRVLIIWRVRILGLVIWIYSTGFHMCPRFYCGPQGAHHLGCSLDHCRVPRTQWHYQGLLHMLWPLWGVSWRSTPKAAAATVFEFGAASLVVTRSSLLFMEAIAIFSLSGRLSSFARLSGAGWQVSKHVYTLFAWYFLLYPHDLIKLRVIKEYFIEKVMLGFIGSNSNMPFVFTDIVIWLFKFAVKYFMYFTEF